MIRVQLPFHLRRLAQVEGEVSLPTPEPATIGGLLTALEGKYPVLRGTVRDQANGGRRAFIRFFACENDLSLQPLSTPLPEGVLSGREPFMIVGAMAGG